MSSTNNKGTANKARVVARALAVSYAMETIPEDSELSKKARKAAKDFKRRRHAMIAMRKKSSHRGRRMSKEEFKREST